MSLKIFRSNQDNICRKVVRAATCLRFFATFLPVQLLVARFSDKKGRDCSNYFFCPAMKITSTHSGGLKSKYDWQKFKILNRKFVIR